MLKGPDVADVDLLRESRGGSAGDEAGADSHAPGRVDPGSTAGAVHHQIHPAGPGHTRFPGNLPHSLAHVLLDVVDEMVGAELTQAMQLVGAVRTSDDGSAGELRQ